MTLAFYAYVHKLMFIILQGGWKDIYLDGIAWCVSCPLYRLMV